MATMFITIGRMDGTSISLHVSKRNTVREIKEMVSYIWKIQDFSFRLLYNGHNLVDDHTLEYYKIEPGDFFDLIVQTYGC